MTWKQLFCVLVVGMTMRTTQLRSKRHSCFQLCAIKQKSYFQRKNHCHDLVIETDFFFGSSAKCFNVQRKLGCFQKQTMERYYWNRPREFLPERKQDSCHDNRVLVWHRLEQARMRTLGLSTAIPRPFTVTRFYTPQRPETRDDAQFPTLKRKQHAPPLATRFSYINLISPFNTLGKPTCGYYYTGDTDHRRKRLGFPAVDIVRTRAATAWF